MRAFDYIAPGRLDEAVALLSGTPGARVLAGGSTLLVEPSRSQLAAPLLVDLRRVDGLAGIDTLADGSLRLGAMATMARVAGDAAVQRTAQALAEAAAMVGDPQVRNRATVGGSVAVNDRAADLPAALLALGATVELVGPGGTRTVEVDAALGGVAADEVIAAVVVPAAAGRTGTAYEKIRHPATLYAICGVAASVTLGADGTVTACRLAITGAASPGRAAAAEAALRGQAPTTAALEAAASLVTDGLALHGDAFGSADYRGHLARVLAGRALTRATERAGAAR